MFKTSIEDRVNAGMSGTITGRFAAIYRVFRTTGLACGCGCPTTARTNNSRWARAFRTRIPLGATAGPQRVRWKRKSQTRKDNSEEFESVHTPNDIHEPRSMSNFFGNVRYFQISEVAKVEALQV